MAQPAFWTGTLLACTVGMTFFVATNNIVEKDAQERFVSIARTVQVSITGRIKSYADLLRGSASLFQTTPDLTREQFHRYVTGLELEKEFPGIEVVNFARHLTQAERPAFESRMRAELAEVAAGYPDFHIEPPQQRAEYTVLTYIEPISPWSKRFGQDLYSRPVVARALDQSRDTGIPSTSGVPVPLRPGITGLGLRMPIYRAGLPLANVQQRRAAYLGSVGIGFSVERLVQGVLDDLPVRNLHLSLVGIGPVDYNGSAERRILLYDNTGEKAGKDLKPRPPLADEFEITLPLDFNQRSWLANFRIKKSALHSEFDAYAPWLSLFGGALSTGLLYALFHTLTTSRRRALALAREMTSEVRASEAKLQRTNENLRRLAAHAENIKEGERKRIAREIHDELGQNLLALRIEADMLASRTSTRHPHLHARATNARKQIDAIMKSVRQIINDLRPNVLDLGLNAAVDWQVNDFRRRTGIACDLFESSHDIRVSDRCATALFRILQESLTNISRHAYATHVRVELLTAPDWISMTVSDNGVGLHPTGPQKKGSFGLVGVEERVKILGGQFAITSSPGLGTTVRVSLPVDGEVPPAVPATEAFAAASEIASHL